MNIILSLLARVFGPPTTARVLSQFNKTLDDLKEVERHHAEQAQRHAEAIAEATANHDAATAEVTSAKAVYGRFLSLINGTVDTSNVVPAGEARSAV